MRALRLVGPAAILLLGACEPRAPDSAAEPKTAEPATPNEKRVPLKGPASEAGLADVLVSPDNLGANLSHEDVMGGPTTLEVCSGDRLKVGNVTDKVVGLEAGVYETDVGFTLGVVRPGEVLAVPAKETGDYLVSAAGHRGYLFHFAVVNCPTDQAAAPNPAAGR